ncbi:MAG: hypothetical protein IPM92_10570 [Saprospiraceae bacterium]|nr:hypothetical protein [Saprospiraceae bacterium]
MKHYTLLSQQFSLVFYLSFMSLSNLQSQDCLNDSIPPVLICKDTFTLRIGQCGNGYIYPENFLHKVYDNCSLESVSYDHDGQIREVELWFLLDNSGLGKNIQIYVRDTSGNVGSCYSFFRISDETYYSIIKMDLNVYSDFWSEEYTNFKLGIKGQDQKVFWNTFDTYTGSQFTIPVYDYLKPSQLRVDINENKSPERSLITTYDMILNIRHITGIQSFEGNINETNGDMNEDGSIDMRDVKAQYDHILHWSPADSIYKPKYKASFIENDGKPIADSISYNSNPSIQYTVSLDQIGNINRSIPFSNIPSQEPIVQFPGEIQYWDTKEIDCKKGQKYVLRFRNSDSSHFFAIQSGMEFNPEFLNVDSVYVPYDFSSKFYSKIFPTAVRTVFFNTSNPQVKSEYPEFYLVITAHQDFKLSEGFKPIHSDMSRLKINHDGEIYPVEFRFNRLKSTAGEEAEIQKFVISPNPSNGVFHLSGYFPGTNQVELNIYDAYSSLIFQKNIQLFLGILNDVIEIKQDGLFYLIIKEGDQVLCRNRIVVK